ncbi:MAG: flagellar filament capping protein FliD, partial [Vampirovibrio sp.]|nr:flagellar filament capping protein FliD [Vampirovibrio sp.]
IDDALVTANGELEIQFTAPTDVHLGATGDTSNFLELTHLATGTATAANILASRGLSTLDRGASIEDNVAARLQTAVTAGSTFTIGSASFDVTGKTMNEIISEINNSSDAGVSAQFNVVTNSLELVSKDSGTNFITLSDDTGNFLEAVGLIAAGDTTTSQTAGTNAEFQINGGGSIFSSSNSVSESITGITGVTLDLVSASPGTQVEININRDIEPLKESINEFIAGYNAVVDFIEQETDSTSESATLTGEPGLQRFKSQIRQLVTSGVSGLTQFTSLPQIGISTGAIGIGTSAVTSRLTFDEAAFEAALAENSTEVEELTRGTNGIFTQLEAILDNAVLDEGDDTLDGFFAAKDNAIQATIKSLDDAIARGEERLATRETALRRQFTFMESLISNFQAQGNALNGLVSQLSANN